jgi:hypothetical protein
VTDDERMPKQTRRHWTDRWPGWLLVIALTASIAVAVYCGYWLVVGRRMAP